MRVALTVLRIVLGVVFGGMGAAHFHPGVQRGMRAMIPPALRRSGLPSTRTLVVVTGVCELAAAVGLQVRLVRRVTGVLLVAFLAAESALSLTLYFVSLGSLPA